MNEKNMKDTIEELVDTIESKVVQFKDRSELRHAQNVAKYRDLIRRFACLTEGDENELERIRDLLHIPIEKIEQHAKAYQEAVELEKELDREPTVKEQLKENQETLDRYCAETNRMLEERKKDGLPLRLAVEKSQNELNTLNRLREELTNLKWKNRDVWADESEMAKQIKRMNERAKLMEENRRKILGGF